MPYAPFSTLAKRGGAMLDSDLPEIQGKLKDVVDDALKESVDKIAATARDNVEVGSGRDPHPGRLRDSIEVVQYNEPGSVGYRVAAGAQADPSSGREGAPYAHMVEYGSIHNLLAKPFLLPALFEHEKETLDTVSDALQSL